MKNKTMPNQPKRIAMWSGARSLSTALMRAWESRPDTVVWDEPLFPPYLLLSGDDYHSRQEVLTQCETDWVKVVKKMTIEPIPEGKTIYYQKHISHLLLVDEMGMDWLSKLTNCILIRDPREMLTSLYQKWHEITLNRTGLPHLEQIFQYIYETTGTILPIIDATDLQKEPRRILSLLCEAVGVEFTEAMLNWPEGKRTTDGAWEKQWYESVKKSTGFRPYKPKADRIPEHLLDVLEQCNEIYQKLYEHRLY